MTQLSVPERQLRDGSLVQVDGKRVAEVMRKAVQKAKHDPWTEAKENPQALQRRRDRVKRRKESNK